jgi:hypothetical protein
MLEYTKYKIHFGWIVYIFLWNLPIQHTREVLQNQPISCLNDSKPDLQELQHFVRIDFVLILFYESLECIKLLFLFFDELRRLVCCALFQSTKNEFLGLDPKFRARKKSITTNQFLVFMIVIQFPSDNFSFVASKFFVGKVFLWKRRRKNFFQQQTVVMLKNSRYIRNCQEIVISKKKSKLASCAQDQGPSCGKRTLRPFVEVEDFRTKKYCIRVLNTGSLSDAPACWLTGALSQEAPVLWLELVKPRKT